MQIGSNAAKLEIFLMNTVEANGVCQDICNHGKWADEEALLSLRQGGDPRDLICLGWYIDVVLDENDGDNVS